MVMHLLYLQNYSHSLNLLWTQGLLNFQRSVIVIKKLYFFSLYSAVHSVFVVYVICGKNLLEAVGENLKFAWCCFPYLLRVISFTNFIWRKIK